MKENKKTLVRFNVQNIKYATPDATAPHGWAKPLPYGTATKMALESDSSVKKIFGDGRRLCAIVNDKGKTGTMSTNNVNDEYEIAMGRKKRLKNGLADIKQQQTVTHCIYFETCGVDEDGGRPVAKTCHRRQRNRRHNRHIAFCRTTLGGELPAQRKKRNAFCVHRAYARRRQN